MFIYQILQYSRFFFLLHNLGTTSNRLFQTLNWPILCFELFLVLFLLNLYQTWRYYTEMHQNTQVRIQEVDQGDWSPSPKM